jgi:hypothetical protein
MRTALGEIRLFNDELTGVLYQNKRCRERARQPRPNERERECERQSVAGNER